MFWRNCVWSLNLDRCLVQRNRSVLVIKVQGDNHVVRSQRKTLVIRYSHNKFFSCYACHLFPISSWVRVDWKVLLLTAVLYPKRKGNIKIRGTKKGAYKKNIYLLLWNYIFRSRRLESPRLGRVGWKTRKLNWICPNLRVGFCFVQEQATSTVLATLGELVLFCVYRVFLIFFWRTGRWHHIWVS